jgi:hypothetical protein
MRQGERAAGQACRPRQARPGRGRPRPSRPGQAGRAEGRRSQATQGRGQPSKKTDDGETARHNAVAAWQEGPRGQRGAETQGTEGERQSVGSPARTETGRETEWRQTDNRLTTGKIARQSQTQRPKGTTTNTPAPPRGVARPQFGHEALPKDCLGVVSPDRQIAPRVLCVAHQARQGTAVLALDPPRRGILRQDVQVVDLARAESQSPTACLVTCRVSAAPSPISSPAVPVLSLLCPLSSRFTLVTRRLSQTSSFICPLSLPASAPSPLRL